MSSILENITGPQPEPEADNGDVFIEHNKFIMNLDSKEILRRLLRLTLPQDVI